MLTEPNSPLIQQFHASQQGHIHETFNRLIEKVAELNYKN